MDVIVQGNIASTSAGDISFDIIGCSTQLAIKIGFRLSARPGNNRIALLIIV